MASEKTADSTTHNEERHAKLKTESEINEKRQAEIEAEREEKQAKRDRKTRKEERQLLTQHARLIPEGTTREDLLERIRQMREDVPKAIVPVGYISDSQREQLNAEQAAGAAAVAKAKKEVEASAEARQKAKAEQLKREGTMETVHHPNPSQDEQFPAQNATLGKKK